MKYSFKKIVLTAFCTITAMNLVAQKPVTLWFDDLPLRFYSESIPSLSAKTNGSGDSLRIAGVTYKRGVGTQSLSVLSLFLDGHAKSFSGLTGADDGANKRCRFSFYIVADKKILFESGEMKPGDAPKPFNVNLSGIKQLGLLVKLNEEATGRQLSDWVNAKFEMLDESMPKRLPNEAGKYILTPTPAKSPKINSSKVFGATPGNPFLYTIAATGERPMQFAATGLPKGLSIDVKTGNITGSINERGTYAVQLSAKNSFGKATKELKIKIGDTIALTPPIGWNGWNSWARNIDREKVIASANAMEKMGLRNHGWTYINIDDGWQGKRDAKTKALLPNEKFPAFKEMIDYIHSSGMKLGMYSTPWITSYAGFAGGSSFGEDANYPDSIINNKRNYRYIGKYRYEKEDAKQMADWGVDYLKYDWRIELNSAERMSQALKKSGRDIIYSLSNSAPFANAADWARVANMYRTGPDIRDSWLSLYLSAFTIDKWAPYGGPGHWNDADMLILGNVTTGAELHPTRLTADEQYSHVSIFSLLAAPLLIGCPIEQLDDFTLNLLTNDEVIEINQDPLGKPGRLVATENGVQTWLKQLEDGSYAVGLFNIDGWGTTAQSYFTWGDEKPKSYSFDFSKLGLKGKWKLRDVWKQKDLGEYKGTFITEINHHGVVMLRLYQR
jgi:alpha-galactosidase